MDETQQQDAAMLALQKLITEARPDTTFLPGLSPEEFATIEAKYKFTFPPDVRRFLAAGVPTKTATKEARGSDIPSELPEIYQTASDGWHQWHELAKPSVEFGGPADTVTKQIGWHATPKGDVHPSEYPLIPLYSHRMIPAVPSREGNPVFSMHGCYDNIVYGTNFYNWLESEFHFQIPAELGLNVTGGTSYKDIPFWDKYIQ